MPFFNACSWKERDFYEDWQRATGLSAYEMCQELQAQRDEDERRAYEDYLWEGEEMFRLQQEADFAQEQVADPDWEAEQLVWKELRDQIQTRLEALVEAHLDETLAVALTEEQLAHYRETLGPEGLEDVLTEFMRDDEANIVLLQLFEARRLGQEIDVDEKVAGLYTQFAREHVERLSLGYA